MVSQAGRVDNSRGMSLLEVIFAAFILAFVLVGLLGSYVACLGLVEVSKNTSIALNNAQTKLEEIKNHNFSQIKTDYNNVSFNVTGIAGKGVSYARYCNSPADCSASYLPTNLLEVIVSVSWQQKNGQIVGEDRDLDGALDSGEDINPANGILDSIAEIITFIAEP